MPLFKDLLSPIHTRVCVHAHARESFSLHHRNEKLGKKIVNVNVYKYHRNTFDGGPGYTMEKKDFPPPCVYIQYVFGVFTSSIPGVYQTIHASP